MSSVSSTSTSTSTSTYNGRISGLVSGIDTDTIVEGLLAAEKAKVFKIEQQKQTAEWEQEAYREVISSIQGFMDTYMNTSDADRNILSVSGYNCVSVQGATDAASFLASSSAQKGTFTLNAIDQIATAASVSSSGLCLGAITGWADLSAGTTGLAGTSFSVRLDGVQQTISFDSDYSDSASLTADLQQKLDDAFGAGRISVSVSADNELQLSAENSIVQVLNPSEGDSALTALGLTAGSQNIVTVGNTLAEVFGTEEDVAFSINGVAFSFSKDTTFTTIMKEINQSDAGVTLTYSSLNDGFTLTSDQTGSASKIVIENTSGNLFGADGMLRIDSGTVKNGQDAIFYYNDPTKSNPVVRSENVFEVDGVTFSLQEATEESITVTVKSDVETAKEAIKAFVEDYNDLVSRLGELVGEKKDSDYTPLSDEQKDEMSESEIAKWEEKAKKGILKSDTLITTLYNRLRNAFAREIEGTTTSFYECGLSVKSYSDKGKLTLDENKLTAALEKDVDAVMALFTQQSDVKYTRDLTSGEASERFNESGFAYRISDIFKDNVSTSRNASGEKGLLIEKAGLEGDITEFSNTLTEQIEDLEDKIDLATERMNDQEDRYYAKFSELEQLVNTMNSQSSWLTSMLGS